MDNSIIALIVIAIFILYLFMANNQQSDSEHMGQTPTQSYVPANYQTVGGINYLKLSDALYAPNMLSSSILAANVNATNINTGNINTDNLSVGNTNIKDTINSLQSTDSVTGELISHIRDEQSSLAHLVQNIQAEMGNTRQVYNANGLLSDSNLIQNIKFTNAWSAYPDDKQDAAEISNDTNKYKTLMIVGNKAKSEGKGVRTVGIWDELNVNGQLNVTGGLNGTRPSVFDWTGNGIFRADKQNELRDQYIMNSPGDDNNMPTIMSRDSKSRGLSISTQGNTPVLINGRDIIRELDLIKARVNY